jgi:hypothetical protein
MSNTHRKTEGLKNYFLHVNTLYIIGTRPIQGLQNHFIPKSCSNAPLNRIQVRGYCTVQDATFPVNCYVPRGRILTIWRHHVVLRHQSFATDLFISSDASVFYGVNILSSLRKCWIQMSPTCSVPFQTCLIYLSFPVCLSNSLIPS